MKTLDQQFDDLITYKQAAELLGMSILGVKQWVRKGYVKKYQVTSRSVFIKKSELLAHIESCEVKRTNA